MQDSLFMVIHGMYLEDIFSQVETNTFNIHDGHLLRDSEVNTSVWHSDAVRWEVSITSGYWLNRLRTRGPGKRNATGNSLNRPAVAPRRRRLTRLVRATGSIGCEPVAPVSVAPPGEIA
jgi:hypothetical protein